MRTTCISEEVFKFLFLPVILPRKEIVSGCKTSPSRPPARTQFHLNYQLVEISTMLILTGVHNITSSDA